MLQDVTRHIVRICILMLAGFMIAACTEKQPVAEKQNSPAARSVTDRSKLLVTIPENEKPQGREAMADHAKANPAEKQSADFFVSFSDNGSSVVYIAKVGDGVRVVHNGKPGKVYKEISDFKIAFSPDGQQVAYGARVDASWRMVVDGTEYGPYENVGPPVFSPDGKHIAYEAQKSGKWHMAVDHSRFSTACDSFFEKPYFSADSSRIAYVVNSDKSGHMRLVISDLDFTKQTVREYNFVYVEQNADKTHVAGTIKTSDNKMRVILFDLLRPDTVKESSSYEEIRNLAFSRKGSSVSFAATKGSVNLLVFNDREERFPDAAVVGMTVLRPDATGSSLIMADKEGAFVHHGFANKAVRGKHYAEADGLVFSRDGRSYAHTARIGNAWTVVVNGKEGTSVYDSIASLQFSPDGTKVVYRARKGTKRFVVVADAQNGTIIKEHQGYERVFEPVFTADGASVAYGVKDGNELWWKVEPL